MTSPLLAICSLWLLPTPLVQDRPSQVAPIQIYVGSQTRGGFVGVDQGVLDSIKDLEREIRSDRPTFRLVPRREDATLVLEVVGRGAGGSGGAVAVPAGGVAVALPIEKKVLRTVLCVGDYEKPIVIEVDDAWRDLAEKVVEDVKTWVVANRAQLPQ